MVVGEESEGGSAGAGREGPSSRLIRTYVRDEGERARDGEAGRGREAAPPEGSNWTLLPSDESSGFEGEAFRLRQRGRWRLRGFGVLLLVTAFVNGIVGVIGWEMLLKPGVERWTWEWIQSALFLGVFGAVGLGFAALTLLEALEVVRTTTWWFERDRIRCRYAYAGIGKTWTYFSPRTLGGLKPMEGETIFSNGRGDAPGLGRREPIVIDRVELHLPLWGKEREREGKIQRRIKKGDRTGEKLAQEWEEAGRLTKEEREQGIFALKLFDDRGEEVCTMGGLRLEDAEWIAAACCTRMTGIAGL